jgi:proteasome lid subunit RPN8/RPN11
VTTKLLSVSSEARKVVEFAASYAHEQEACGFMFGYTHGEVAYAVVAREVRNVAASPTRFAIAGNEFLEATQAGWRGLQVICMYHTHYGSARPSRRDRESLMSFSYLWLIVGEAAPAPIHTFSDWRCFACVSSKVRRVNIEFV